MSRWMKLQKTHLISTHNTDEILCAVLPPPPSRRRCVGGRWLEHLHTKSDRPPWAGYLWVVMMVLHERGVLRRRRRLWEVERDERMIVEHGVAKEVVQRIRGDVMEDVRVIQCG